MTQGTGGQRFQVSKLLELATWLMFLKLQLGGLGSDKVQTFRAQVLPVSDTRGSILQWESKGSVARWFQSMTMSENSILFLSLHLKP